MAFDDNPFAPPPGANEPTRRLWAAINNVFFSSANVDAALLAIEQGATLDARNRVGNCLLDIALRFDRSDYPWTRLLLGAGAPIGSAMKKRLRSALGPEALSNELARRGALQERQDLAEGLAPAPARLAARM